jgi:hypothetical protein
MTPTEETELKAFLIHTASLGYGNESSVKVRESDGSVTITITKGDWEFRDNYFVSTDTNRFYGREVILKHGKPYWFMGYAGFAEPGTDVEELNKFLRLALLEPDSAMPVRGPLELSSPDWQYAFIPGDSLEEFYAAEWIKHDGANVYLAHLHGGLIA